ncbi:hypothetical protein HG536_0C04910 [Torulaspora globosa]|uniref:3-oxoacyl-[acyl-carrier-protein] synthase n=1 Tax=Torulaspora globosa TaxID=48254 RepID=A0A7G3ZFN6_9SACH|nr:uncharacterized protein HG536_0C04910 [Torulaspora globosa]QLL32322.1 hypothetical protein HG536_0C04910 [Torulaspora globosa]
MATRVVVTGLGCRTPLGASLAESWQNLLKGRSGIVALASLPNYSSDFEPVSHSIPASVTVGKCQDGLEQSGGLITDQDQRRCAQFTKLALLSTEEALKDAGLLNEDNSTLDTSKADPERFGCVIGSGIGSIEDICSATLALHNDRKKVSPLFIPRILSNMAAGNVSIKFGLKGISHCVSTACATGNNAIGDAYNFIRLGMQDICVAGASESCINPLSLAGFIRAKSINTDDGVSRPFDRRRSGFVLGEGAGSLVVESLESALRRKATIYAEIKGYGLSSDAFHITSPSLDGEGARRAMKMAIEMGKIDASDVGYVNAHATSTVLGDRAESHAIKATLLPGRREELFVSSNKGAIGHLLGAAGAVESIFTIMALKDRIIPHTLNLTDVGGAKGDDYEALFSGINFLQKQPRKHEGLRYALCNSFGFGGVNTCLLFERWQHDM